MLMILILKIDLKLLVWKTVTGVGIMQSRQLQNEVMNTNWVIKLNVMV